jgi:excisionase family DNA binding protein
MPTDPSPNQAPVDPLTVSELITLDEASEYCGLSKHSLSTYIRNGRLKAKKMGNLWVTTKAAVDLYLASREIERHPIKQRSSS